MDSTLLSVYIPQLFHSHFIRVVHMSNEFYTFYGLYNYYHMDILLMEDFM